MDEDTGTQNKNLGMGDDIDNETKDTKNSCDDNDESTNSKDSKNHLTEIPDGAGCTEIWEHISQNRDKK